MHKKSSIGSIFIYALSATIVILILYFGYKGISGINEARQESLLESAKLRMNADFSQIALRYDTTANFEYQLPSKFKELCFVDLFVAGENKTARDNAMSFYIIINDSVASNRSSNVFFVGEATEPFYAGKIRLSCSPYFYCFQPRAGRVNFQATGKGTYILIANESGFC